MTNFHSKYHIFFSWHQNGISISANYQRYFYRYNFRNESFCVSCCCWVVHKCFKRNSIYSKLSTTTWNSVESIPFWFSKESESIQLKVFKNLLFSNKLFQRNFSFFIIMKHSKYLQQNKIRCHVYIFTIFECVKCEFENSTCQLLKIAHKITIRISWIIENVICVPNRYAGNIATNSLFHRRFQLSWFKMKKQIQKELKPNDGTMNE